MTNIQQEMIEYTTRDIVVFLMEDYGLNINAAMDILYTSKTFEHLVNVDTGLYLEESSYVFEMLKSEPGFEDKCKCNIDLGSI